MDPEPDVTVSEGTSRDQFLPLARRLQTVVYNLPDHAFARFFSHAKCDAEHFRFTSIQELESLVESIEKLCND